MVHEYVLHRPDMDRRGPEKMFGITISFFEEWLLRLGFRISSSVVVAVVAVFLFSQRQDGKEYDKIKQINE